MRWFVMFVAVPVALGVVSTASAQGVRTDSAAVVAAVERFGSALAAKDSTKAVLLLAKDALVLESGEVQTRAEYLSGHLGADMRATSGSTRVRTVVQVTLVGDAAYVVSRTARPPAGAGAAAGSDSAELMVLSKTSTGWVIRAIHWSSRRRRS